MLKEGDKKDQQLVALRIFFESGSEEEKRMARDALFVYAFPATNTGTTPPYDNAITLDDDSNHSIEDELSKQDKENEVNDEDSTI